MAIPIQLRRNGTAASTPSSLLHGEVALNYADGKIFWKDASNVIQSFTFQAYALSSHTHAASDVTSGTLDAARLPLATTIAAGAVIVGTGLGVSSGTVSVTYGTSAGTACQGNDARLSDTRTPTDNTVSTAKLQNDAVTYAKIQNVSAGDRLLGRSSAGAGDVEEIVCTSFGRALLDDTSHAAQLTTLGAAPTASPTFTGTVNAAAVTLSGVLLVTAGSVSAPGVAFSGDTNTGMYSPGADQLAFSTNQTERLLIDAGGVTTFTSSLTDGQVIVRNATANNAEKYGTFAGQHYTNAEEPALGMFVQSNLTDNIVGIGGALGTFNAATQFRVYTAANNTTTSGTERLRVDANGNLLMAGSGSVAAAASAAGAIHIKNGTAPSASITDGVVLFAADVSSSSELRVRDEAGNTTTLSPHAFPLIPDGPSEPMAWAYYSERDGRRINVDMLRVVRLLEQLTGEKLVYED